jgi:Heterokaryon incompatibility protein (HET)
MHQSTGSEEKSHQVRKMQTIYAKATQVTVCLGDSPDAHLARGLIVKLYSFIVMFNPKDWTEAIASIYITSQKLNDWNKPPEWLALKKMLRNPWFERCWVLQEVVLARKIFVMYGGRYIDWNVLQCVIQAFTHEQAGPIRKLLVGEDGHRIATTPASLLHAPMMEGYRRAHREGEQLHLHAMLRNTLTFKATDSRDKNFALQGFTEAASALPIDYKLALEEVLINTARYFLKRPEGIEVLQQAGIGWTEESDGLKTPS